jgi:hypothetical protein
MRLFIMGRQEKRHEALRKAVDARMSSRKADEAAFSRAVEKVSNGEGERIRASKLAHA